ncbi:MAG TPA: hypothetical protein VGX68_16095 [Thermoanaerobaculia bacterium]|jgi:hypothetical protein|nr:hypothetical protein [Thermoanaerobaculia bacterium]
MKKIYSLPIFALVLLAVLCAGPALAEETAAPAAAPAIAAVPTTTQAGCGETLDLAAALSGKGEICPAALPQNPAPELKVGRTCRCSCGQPCKKDEDCGPGGLCMGGITCC